MRMLANTCVKTAKSNSIIFSVRSGA